MTDKKSMHFESIDDALQYLFDDLAKIRDTVEARSLAHQLAITSIYRHVKQTSPELVDEMLEIQRLVEERIPETPEIPTKRIILEELKAITRAKDDATRNFEVIIGGKSDDETTG